MSDENRFRHLKFCVLWLVLFSIMLSYPLGLGPLIYVLPDLPMFVRGPVWSLYTPINGALESESFRNSSIGDAYMSYLGWWVDRKYGDGFWDRYGPGNQ